jgi:hypothetical protein
MRVTLINPPRFFEIEPNLGLLYIASVLEKAGHEVAIVDKPINRLVGGTWETLNASFNETIQEVCRTRPDLIGMTATCHTSYALDLLNILKDVKKKPGSSWEGLTSPSRLMTSYRTTRRLTSWFAGKGNTLC